MDSNHTMLNALLIAVRKGLESYESLPRDERAVFALTTAAAILHDIESQLCNPDNLNLYAVGLLYDLRQDIETLLAREELQDLEPQQDEVHDDGIDDGKVEYNGALDEVTDLLVKYATERVEANAGEMSLIPTNITVDSKSGTFHVEFHSQ